MIAISIPTFNRADRLRSAIRSVEMLPEDIFPISVYDNGSTDETESVVKEFGPRVQCFSWSVNRGIGPNWQRAVANTKEAKWVIVLSDDDTLVESTAIELQKTIEKKPDWEESVGMIVFNAGMQYGEHAGFKISKPNGAAAYSLMQSILQGKAPVPSAVVFNTKALSAIGGFVEDYADTALDIPTYTKLMAAGYECVMFPQELCQYSKHNENFTSSVTNSNMVKLYEGLRNDVFAFEANLPKSRALTSILYERITRCKLNAMDDDNTSTMSRLRYLYSARRLKYIFKLQMTLVLLLKCFNYAIESR